MSLSVYVSCHTCGEALNHAKTSLPGGLRPLFEALHVPVQDWDGKTGVSVLPAIQSAVQELSDSINRDYLKAQHDTRGDWSRVDFALPFLTAMRDAICRDPYATVSVT